MNARGPVERSAARLGGTAEELRTSDLENGKELSALERCVGRRQRLPTDAEVLTVVRTPGPGSRRM